jgi:hypothetical protein
METVLEEFLQAAVTGDLETIRRLHQGASGGDTLMCATNNEADQCTALHLASWFNHLSVVEYICANCPPEVLNMRCQRVPNFIVGYPARF